MYTFGPVPSRRLGRSLGINNIPPKICSYSCVYCQLGNTIKMEIDRKYFYEPDNIFEEVKNKIEDAAASGEVIDYLAFVPDGEPTLDINLGREIELLKPLGIKIAVITNSSLMWHEDVRAELMNVDWISLKVDTVSEDNWHKIDRPHGRLVLDKILDGIQTFANEFNGYLTTETMLVSGINDTDESLKSTSAFISKLNPMKAYLTIPTRPPAEPWAKPPEAKTINRAYQIYNDLIKDVELLTGYEGNAFSLTSDVKSDLLSITAVHPMRRDAVEQFLLKANSHWSMVQKLIDKKEIIELEYNGKVFYLKNISNTPRDKYS